MYNNVTLVLTSCNRVDLLERTLRSLGKELLESIPHKIIVDDSGDPAVRNYFSQFSEREGWQILLNEENIGQPHSVDKAYSLVKTPYIFHCEDDWEFTNTSFLSECLDILEFDKQVLQVTFREGCPHAVEPQVYLTPSKVSYQIKERGWRGEWWGFTYPTI